MTAVLRQLIRELRHISKKGPMKDSPAVTYVINEYHKYQVTGAKHCKEKDEMQHLAETYLCLLKSNKKQSELSAQYSRGERSPAEAANLVGLSMPITYKP